MLSRPSQDALNLSDYWNALDRGASPEDLERLATAIPASDREAIQRVRVMHQPHAPDSQFALRLERIHMNAASHPASQAVPLPRIPTPRDRAPGRSGPWRPEPVRRTLAHWGSAALRVALALLMIFLMASGIWIFTRHDGNHQIATPPVATATPTVQSSSDVPMYRGNPARTGVFPGPALVGSPVELWTLQMGEPVNLGAAVVDGVLYFPAGANGFEAHDAMTGDLIWSFATDAPAVSAPAVADGLAYVIDSDGTLYAVRTSDGSEAWRMANLNVRSSVAPVGGALYAVSPEGTFYALDAATGSIRWQAELGAEAAGGMAVADGVAFQGNQAGVMTAFDAESGEVLWTFQNEGHRNNATVTVASGQIYITISGGDTNAMYAVDVKTGKQIWRQEQGPGLGFISATATETRLYSVAEDGQLHALDAATGETVWTYQLREFMRSIPVLVEDTLYVADNGGFVRAIDAETGTQEWEYTIKGAVDFGWPVVANGVLYIGTDFGNFYAITGSGMLAARSITPTVVAEASPAASPVAEFDPAGMSLLWQSGPDAKLTNNTGVSLVDAKGITYVTDIVANDFVMFGPDGEYLGHWGKQGSGPGEFQFDSPEFGMGMVDVDADGNYYVFDGLNHRIQKFDSDRTFIKTWGSFGTEPGQFNIVGGVVDRANHRIYANDALNNRIQVFDLDGNLLDVWGEFGSEPGKLIWPVAMAVAPDGSLYIAEETTRRVQHFGADGTPLGVLEQPGGGSAVIYALAFDPAGNLWEASVNPPQIVVFRPDGAVLSSFDELPGIESLGSPSSLVFGPDGNLTISTVTGQPGEFYVRTGEGANRVLRYALAPGSASGDLTGTARIAWESNDADAMLSHAQGVTLAPDGTIWVADGAHSRVLIFDQDGTLLDAWGKQGSGEGQFNFINSSNGDGLGGVAFGSDGSIYVADTGNTRIQQFDSDGNFLNAWGTRGGGNGQFVSPFALAIDSQGNLFVSDNAREDIQKFSADGTWLATFGGSGSAPGKLNYQTFLTVAPDDTVWVADPENYRIQHFANDGAFIAAIPFAEIPGKPVWVQSLAFDSAGRLYLADIDGSRLFALDPDGSVLGVWSLTLADGSPNPNSGGLVVSADGVVFLSDWLNGTLYRYDLDPPLDSSSATPVATPAT